MTTLSQIEKAIEELPRDDFRALVQRLRERDADLWDQQIAEDAHNGKLDALYERLTSAEMEGDSVPLDEMLDDPGFS